jgi:hypothetical protein
MTQFTPEWKLTVNGVNLTGAAISQVSHRTGRTNIYSQPTASTLSIKLVALQNNSFNIAINDVVALQVKDTTGTYKTLFGGNISDLSTSISNTGSIGTTFVYSIIAVGSLSRLTKIPTEGVLTSAFDGDQIETLLTEFLAGNWNAVSPAQEWANYDPVVTWENAETIGLGEIDTPGQYEMVNRSSSPDSVYNIASLIANSAFGILFEDNSGNISYADADHRQNYLADNGSVYISANTAIGTGIQTTTRAGDIRNDITLNYGNSFNDTEILIDAASVDLYGYKGETINSTIKKQEDAEAIVEKYIALRAIPKPVFETITFPITNPELSDIERNALLGIFMGQPITITDLPVQISKTQEFLGFVEGWSWSTSFNQLFLTINLSPLEFNQVAAKWNGVNASEAWNTLSGILTWENAIGVVA